MGVVRTVGSPYPELLNGRPNARLFANVPVSTTLSARYRQQAHLIGDNAESQTEVEQGPAPGPCGHFYSSPKGVPALQPNDQLTAHQPRCPLSCLSGPQGTLLCSPLVRLSLPRQPLFSSLLSSPTPSAGSVAPARAPGGLALPRGTLPSLNTRRPAGPATDVQPSWD